MSVGLENDFALFGGFLAGGKALAEFAGAGPLNRDDRPVVAYQASGFVYAQPEPAWVRLLELIEQVDADASAHFVDAEGGSGFAARLEDYWRARDLYLSAGVGVAPGDDVRTMLAQLREPLLSITAVSSDFIPAYRPLVELAFELHRVDPGAARKLLDDIIATAPERPEARQLREQLFGS